MLLTLCFLFLTTTMGGNRAFFSVGGTEFWHLFAETRGGATDSRTVFDPQHVWPTNHHKKTQFTNTRTGPVYDEFLFVIRFMSIPTVDCFAASGEACF